jgi:hypothetical protein
MIHTSGCPFSLLTKAIRVGTAVAVAVASGVVRDGLRGEKPDPSPELRGDKDEVLPPQEHSIGNNASAARRPVRAVLFMGFRSRSAALSGAVARRGAREPH